MLKTRIIPCLQLIGDSLVKTVRFRNPDYIGDPINTVRIFNELQVDELCFLDIRATIEKRRPSVDILQKIADECFMPLSYGGGITDFSSAHEVLSIGFEKIIVNTQLYANPGLITQLAKHFGSQSVMASIDVKKKMWGSHTAYIKDGSEKIDIEVIEFAKRAEDAGAGEILLTSIDREGTWSGFDLEITRKVSEAVRVPVIANGGAGSIQHIADVIKKGHASAACLGSMVVYQQKGMGVLVNFPDKRELEQSLDNH